MSIKFGTAGWRDIIADEFTFNNVALVTQAIANYLNRKYENNEEKNSVVVGYDTRFHSENFAKTCAEVLIANGIFTYLTDRATPTPVIAYEVGRRNSKGGIIITASHNPPEYNGLKFSVENGHPMNNSVSAEIEKEICILEKNRNVFRKDLKDAENNGLLEIIGISEEYIARLKGLVDTDNIARAKLKIVVDLMYGPACGYLDRILKDLNCEVRSIHDYRDPYFGNVRPEPLPENLIELINTVRETDAQIGLAVDADADRFGVIDKNGVWIESSQLLALILNHLIKNRKMTGGVGKSVATSHLVDAVAEKYGEKIFVTPIGFKNLAPLITKEKVIVAGEESGGLSIQGHIPERDGILANLLIIEMIVWDNKTLSEMLTELNHEHGNFVLVKKRLELKPGMKERILDELKINSPQKIGGFRVAQTDKLDGFKYILENESWVMIRPSGTEPVLRLYAEAKTTEKAGKLMDSLEKTIHS